MILRNIMFLKTNRRNYNKTIYDYPIDIKETL